MKLSDKTLSVIKSFAVLNPSLLFPIGEILETISVTETIMGRAMLDQKFEKRFAIGDVPRFLGALSLFKEYDLNFEDTQVNICSGKERIKYTYASEDAIKTPKKKLRLPSVDAVVTLPAATLKAALKARSVLALPELAIVGGDNKLLLYALDASETRWLNNNNYAMELGEWTTDTEFTAVFRAEYLEKLLPADYHVSISSKGFAHFKGEDVEYYVALEAKPSRFGRGH